MGVSPRIASSGPSAATSRPTSAATFLLLAPAAKISPAARTASLQRKDADRLYRALESALRSAIAKGGVHTGDVIAARHPGGTCPRCGAEMKHGTVGGRSTWWCSREQTGP